MKLNNVKVFYQRLVNTGNYENETFGVEYSVSVKDGTSEEKMDSITEVLHQYAKEQVLKQIKNRLKKS